jgi:hypothetical protein
MTLISAQEVARISRIASEDFPSSKSIISRKGSVVVSPLVGDLPYNALASDCNSEQPSAARHEDHHARVPRRTDSGNWRNQEVAIVCPGVSY